MLLTPATLLCLCLGVAVLGLLSGPLLAAAGAGRSRATAAIDGLVLGLVPTLVIVRLLPHVCASLGAWGLLCALGGYGVLSAVDRHGHGASARFGQAILLPAMALHAAADGASVALFCAASDGRLSSGLLLAAAVLLHRLPEGLFLSGLFLPSVGLRGTLGRLSLLAAATVGGALLGESALALLPDRALDAAAAFGLGAMLRFALHAHAAPPAGLEARAWAGGAFAAGLSVALLTPSPAELLRQAQPHELSVLDSLRPLFIETSPWLLLGLLLGAKRAGSEPPAREGDAGAELWPGVLVIGRLLGAPTALVLGLVSALGQRAAGATPGAGGAPEARSRGLLEGLRDRVREAIGPSIDRLGSSYVGGLIGAAVIEASVPAGSGAAAVSGWGLLGAVALRRSPARAAGLFAAPCLTMLVHKGLPLGAAIGLWGVVTLGRALRGEPAQRAKLAAALLGLALLAAIATALLPESAPALHPLLAHQHRAIEELSAALLAFLLALSLLRTGPRPWLGPPPGHHPHEEEDEPRAPAPAPARGWSTPALAARAAITDGP